MSIHEPAERLLIIGLDGGTWDIFGPLCDLGEMPNLARLRAGGVWSELRSTQPPFTAPAWATFATGVNPGRHGVLHFLRKPADPLRSLAGEGAAINSTHVAANTLWHYLSAAGQRVGVINQPLSYPLPPFTPPAEGCFAISGLMTPPAAPDFTWPPELAAHLRGYVVDLDYGRAGQPLQAADLPAPAEMLADIARMTERRGFHTLRLMQSQPWDTLMVVFTGTDRIFHHFWRYLQPQAGEEADRLDIALSEKLRQYFRLLDNILGGLIRSAGSRANVVILSDHGFGPAAQHWAHLNNWLLELDLLRLQMAGGGNLVHRLRQAAPWLRDIAKRILPAEARAAVQRQGRLADAVDWPHTQAWAEPLYNNVAGVFLHRAGRYAEGCVSPAAVETLRRRILAAAADLRIPGSRRPLILDAQPREAVYNGPHLARFPDILLTLDPDYAAVPTLGATLITPAAGLLRSGDHRPAGMFLAYGPNLRSGPLEPTPGLIDLAPTLLHLADLPIPAGMEGAVLTGIFDRGYLVLHPPRTGPDLPPPPPPTDFSAYEDAAVTDRLRGLGYLQ